MIMESKLIELTLGKSVLLLRKTCMEIMINYVQKIEISLNLHWNTVAMTMSWRYQIITPDSSKISREMSKLLLKLPDFSQNPR